MGNFKSFIFFGYEYWGELKPECIVFEDKKRIFIPLYKGFWIRSFQKKHIKHIKHTK